MAPRSGDAPGVAVGSCVPEGTLPAAPAAACGLALKAGVIRSTISARSNSANTPSICTIIRPAGLPVSNGSVAERKITQPVELSTICASPVSTGEPFDAVDEQHVEATALRVP